MKYEIVVHLNILQFVFVFCFCMSKSWSSLGELSKMKNLWLMNWNFLREVVEKMGLGQKWVGWMDEVVYVIGLLFGLLIFFGVLGA